MEIRLATLADYSQLSELLLQLNPEDAEASTNTQEAFKAIIASDLLSLIVAEDKSQLIGSCYLNIIPNMTRGARPYALIENVITDATHRKQGIGKALVKNAIEMAWQNNCYKVMLMSGRKDPCVHSFYKQCGFNAEDKQAYVLRAPSLIDK